MPRGKIRNYARARQQRDYSGLRYGNITPSDIDGHIEYHDICHIFIEIKSPDVEMPYGQKLEHERLNDDLSQVKPTLTILVENNESNPMKDICVATCPVVSIYRNKQWRVAKKPLTVKEVIDSFIQEIETDSPPMIQISKEMI